MATKQVSQKTKTSKVLECLGQNRLMTLGTAQNNKPWAATVFFAYDKNLSILFYSQEKTKHCWQIKNNPYVSVSINHNWKDEAGLIKGLQITGQASKVSKKDYQRYYAIFEARFKWAKDFAGDHVLYIIKPKEIWYIDQKLFGHFFRVRVI